MTTIVDATKPPKEQWCRVCKRTTPKSIFACRYKVHQENIEGMQQFYDMELTIGDLCDRCYRAYYKFRKEKGQLATGAGATVAPRKPRVKSATAGAVRKRTSTQRARPAPATTILSNPYDRFASLAMYSDTLEDGEEDAHETGSTDDEDDGAEETGGDESEAYAAGTASASTSGGDYRVFNSVALSRLYRPGGAAGGSGGDVVFASPGCSPNNSAPASPFLTGIALPPGMQLPPPALHLQQQNRSSYLSGGASMYRISGAGHMSAPASSSLSSSSSSSSTTMAAAASAPPVLTLPYPPTTVASASACAAHMPRSAYISPPCELEFAPTHNDQPSAPSRRKGSPHKSAQPTTFFEQMQPCDFLWESSPVLRPAATGIVGGAAGRAAVGMDIDQ